MNISILLPYKENFVSNNAGAVSLFVNDITKNSIYIDASDSRMTMLLKLSIISTCFFIVASTSIPKVRNKLLKKMIRR